jgi:hypothetical protein
MHSFSHLVTDSNDLTVFSFVSNLDNTKTIFDYQATNLVMHDC